MHKWIIAAAAASALAPALVRADAIEPLAQNKVSGYKVLTSQLSVAAQQKINSAKRMAEAQMAAIALMASSIEQLEVFKDHSPMMGQGAQVCDAVNQRSDIARIADVRKAYDIGNVRNAGRASVPATTYVSTRIKQQLDDYCSVDQHNLGLCRARSDGMANASTDYSQLDSAEQFTSKQLKASNDFIANLVPGPSLVAIAGKCGPKCQSVIASAKQLDSISSMAAFGLASQFSNRVGAKTYAPLVERATQ